MRLYPSAIAVLLLFWTVSANGAESSGKAKGAETSGKKVKLINSDRKEIGEVDFQETTRGVLVRLHLQDRAAKISAGAHAVHLHEVGRCEPPFKSAGAHLNPTNQKHGFLSKDGAHIGDLPNIHVPQSGPLTVEMMIPQASLSGGKMNLIDTDGFALVVHQGADDYKSDPAGDAGDRIACAAVDGTKAAKAK